MLSNASLLHKETVFNALGKIDKNILKLDAGTDETFKIINQSKGNVSIDDIVYYLKKFNGNLIIQTLFFEGEVNGHHVSNINKEEIDAWIERIKEIKPQYVMIYPIARQTPTQSIRKISFAELNKIAARLEKAGFKTQVYG